MEIDNEFRVQAPIDHAWRILTDLAGIAPCLPGAQLTGVEGDTFLGKVKVKVGPVTTEYTGKASFVERDDTTHRATIDARGNESRGAGTASARISASLRQDGGDTVVSVHTDMTITGKVAQFGRGMIEEISARLLGQFAANVEAKIQAGEPPPPGASGSSADPPLDLDAGGTVAAGAPASLAGPEPEPLDLLRVAGDSLAKRLVPALVVLVATIVIVRLAFGRRRGRRQSDC